MNSLEQQTNQYQQEQGYISEDQQVNRIAKGNEIYKAGLVEPISNNEYIVSGKYYLEDFGNGTYTCNCADHTFRQVICKHIIAVQFYQLGL